MKNRTYRYYQGKPLFPFGYGLSYTTFAYSGLKVSPESSKAGAPVNVSVTVTNSGSVEGRRGRRVVSESASRSRRPDPRPQGIQAHLARSRRLDPGPVLADSTRSELGSLGRKPRRSAREICSVGRWLPARRAGRRPRSPFPRQRYRRVAEVICQALENLPNQQVSQVRAKLHANSTCYFPSLCTL